MSKYESILRPDSRQFPCNVDLVPRGKVTDETTIFITALLYVLFIILLLELDPLIYYIFDYKMIFNV